MQVHFGHRVSREGWWSFETHPRMMRTKRRIHERCLPCLAGLLDQLKADRREIDLPHAWDCWKVVAVAPDEATCMEILDRLAGDHPDLYLHGKLGGRRDRYGTSALVLHAEGEAERDRMVACLQQTLERRFPHVPLRLSRACADPYAEILGPWQEWTLPCPIRRPEAVPRVVRRLRELLYGAG